MTFISHHLYVCTKGCVGLMEWWKARQHHDETKPLFTHRLREARLDERVSTGGKVKQ